MKGNLSRADADQSAVAASPKTGSRKCTTTRAGDAQPESASFQLFRARPAASRQGEPGQECPPDAGVAGRVPAALLDAEADLDTGAARLVGRAFAGDRRRWHAAVDAYPALEAGLRSQES